jgi:hypothetical protein
MGATAVAVAVRANPREEAMLAEANLLRMRGQWEEAEARCIEVMRLSAHSVHAHSLLGDIYRDQGRLDEAAQWYQMALDLQPDSGADRVKLAAVVKQQAKQLARAGHPKPRIPTKNLAGTQSLMGLSPPAFFRLMWVVVAVFVVVVVGLIVWTRNSRPDQPLVPSGTLPGTAVRPSLPEGITGSMPSGGTTSGLPRTGDAKKPDGARPNATGQTAPGAAPPSGTGFSSERESALQSSIARQAGLGPQVQVAAVTVDPREQRATIVLLERPGSEVSSPEQTREMVLRDAARAAQAAFVLDTAFNRVSVNARVAVGGRQPEPYFAGDLDRASAQRLREGSPIDQVLSTFTGVWWSPDAGAPQPSAADSGRGGAPYSDGSQ